MRMKIALAWNILTISTALAQGEPPTLAAARDAAAQAELARVVQNLDALIEQTAAAHELALATLQNVRAASAKATAADLERASRIAGGLHDQLSGLSAELGKRIQSLRELRERAAAEVPAHLFDALAPLRQRIAEAVQQPDLTAVETALLRLEEEFTAEPLRSEPGVDALLGLVRYRLADTLRQRAALAIERTNGQREAEKLMARALRSFGDTLLCADSADTGEGSSLHAAALRRIVQAEAIFYDGFKRLNAARPGVRSYLDSMRRHRENAEQAFSRLKRLHPDATLADGTTAVAVARRDVDRVLGQ